MNKRSNGLQCTTASTSLSSFFNCRIGSRTEVGQEAAAWQTKRNGQAVGINWRFTTADARIKLAF